MGLTPHTIQMMNRNLARPKVAKKSHPVANGNRFTASRQGQATAPMDAIGVHRGCGLSLPGGGESLISLPPKATPRIDFPLYLPYCHFRGYWRKRVGLYALYARDVSYSGQSACGRRKQSLRGKFCATSWIYQRDDPGIRWAFPQF